MNHDDLCSLLQNKINELQKGVDLPWRIVPGNPKNPAGLKPHASWEKWTNPTEHPLKLRKKKLVLRGNQIPGRTGRTRPVSQ